MAKVLCTLPNASEEISGVKFEQVDGGMLSEEISDELAEHFTSIKGYEFSEAKKSAPAKVLSKAEKAAADKAEAESKKNEIDDASAAAAAEAAKNGGTSN